MRYENIFEAIKAGDIREVTEFLDKGVDIDSEDYEYDEDACGYTPIYWAAEGGKLDIVKLLLDRGCKVRYEYYCCSPLHGAVFGGKPEIVALILDAGADINIRNIDEYTPLYCAVELENLEIVRLLLARGADVNAEDNLGQTPLHYSASQGNLEIVSLLLDKDADVNVVDKYHYSPLCYAADSKHPEIVSFLLDKGASINKLRRSDVRVNQEIEAVIAKHIKDILVPAFKFIMFKDKIKYSNSEKCILEKKCYKANPDDIKKLSKKDLVKYFKNKYPAATAQQIERTTQKAIKKFNQSYDDIVKEHQSYLNGEQFSEFVHTFHEKTNINNILYALPRDVGAIVGSFLSKTDLKDVMAKGNKIADLVQSNRQSQEAIATAATAYSAQDDSISSSTGREALAISASSSGNQISSSSSNKRGREDVAENFSNKIPCFEESTKLVGDYDTDISSDVL